MRWRRIRAPAKTGSPNQQPGWHPSGHRFLKVVHAVAVYRTASAFPQPPLWPSELSCGRTIAKPALEVEPADAAYNPACCGCSSMVERQLPKLHTRVRFPSPAPHFRPARQQRLAGFFMGECRHVPRPLTRGVTIWCGTHTLCPGHRCGSPLRWTQPDLGNELHFGGHGLESQDGCQYPQGRTSVCPLSKALCSPVSGSANSSDLASNCRGRE